MAPDPLGVIRARPALIERAVRAALIEAMTWRLGGGAPPAENAFACAAAAAARQAASHVYVAATTRADVTQAASAAYSAAVRFIRTPLGKRLMTLPLAQIVVTPRATFGADVVIRDRRGRLHLIALTALRRPLDIGTRARSVRDATHVAPQDRLAPVRVHLYSLASGIRHEFASRTSGTGTEARTA